MKATIYSDGRAVISLSFSQPQESFQIPSYFEDILLFDREGQPLSYYRVSENRIQIGSETYRDIKEIVKGQDYLSFRLGEKIHHYFRPNFISERIPILYSQKAHNLIAVVSGLTWKLQYMAKLNSKRDLEALSLTVYLSNSTGFGMEFESLKFNSLPLISNQGRDRSYYRTDEMTSSALPSAQSSSPSRSVPVSEEDFLLEYNQQIQLDEAANLILRQFIQKGKPLKVQGFLFADQNHIVEGYEIPVSVHQHLPVGRMIFLSQDGSLDHISHLPEAINGYSRVLGNKITQIQVTNRNNFSWDKEYKIQTVNLDISFENYLSLTLPIQLIYPLNRIPNKIVYLNSSPQADQSFGNPRPELTWFFDNNERRFKTSFQLIYE